jgi:hypothetical protein
MLVDCHFVGDAKKLKQRQNDIGKRNIIDLKCFVRRKPFWKSAMSN